MRRTRVLWEVYVTRFEEALDRYKRHRLSAEEAGELLGLSGRHFRRQCARYASAGIDGPRDKRLGRVSHRRAPESELARMRRLYRDEYADFTVKHFHEELRRRHNYLLGSTVTRLALQSVGLVTPARRRGKHRRKRQRWPIPGMLLLQPGDRQVGPVTRDGSDPFFMHMCPPSGLKQAAERQARQEVSERDRVEDAGVQQPL
jgi:hypothetical protein